MLKVKKANEIDISSFTVRRRILELSLQDVADGLEVTRQTISWVEKGRGQKKSAIVKLIDLYLDLYFEAHIKEFDSNTILAYKAILEHN